MLSKVEPYIKREKKISRREYEVIFDAGKTKRNARKDAKNLLSKGVALPLQRRTF
ncbi:hypothetical protein KUL106_01720 [Alteromonas sp. KUL106]|nr:hypothetical protein KUL106_01720 [Alteromonas sp. KUL106]